MTSRPRIPLYELLAVFIWGCGYFGSPNLAGDPGLGWHLRTGELIWNSGTIPRTDPFLWGNPNAAWSCNQWFADVLFYLVHEHAGIRAVGAVVSTLQVIALVVLPVCLLGRFGIGLGISLASLVMLIGVGGVQWFARPVVWSFFLFSLLASLVARKRFDRFGLLSWAIFAAWANLHPAWILGLAYLVISAVGDVIDDRAALRPSLAVNIGMAILGTLCTPLGWSLHANTLRLSRSEYFMNLNTDWLSPSIFEPVFVPFYATWFLFCFLCLRGYARKTPIALTLPTVAIGLMGHLHNRYTPFFALSAALPLAMMLQAAFQNSASDPLQRISSNLRAVVRPPSYWILAALIAGTTVMLFTGDSKRNFAAELPPSYPVEAVPLLMSLAGEQPLRIFTSPNWGGYFTYALWPKASVFIDDRNEVNGEALYETYFDISSLRNNWRQQLARIQPDVIVLDSQMPLFEGLKIDANWLLRYENTSIRVFTRRH